MKTLEEILNALGSKTPFLNVNEVAYLDSEPQTFTKSGAVAYGKLTDILYTVGELTDTNVSGIIAELDSICNED